MRFLLFVSLFFCMFTSCATSKKLAVRENAVIPFWTAELIDTVKKNDFRILLSTPKTDITGIFIVKRVNGEWRGTMINEFGLKVLDFVSTAKNCKVVNAISFLNKWYIKKVVASDIQFMMEIDNPAYTLGVQSNRNLAQETLVVRHKNEKELQRFSDGTIKYTNHKRKLTYSLKKIYETER